MVMCLCLVNYRGSGGFGQESVFSLPGKIGGQEVRDVQVSLKFPNMAVMAVRKSPGVWVQSLHGSEEIGSKETRSEDQTVYMQCTHFLGGFL